MDARKAPMMLNPEIEMVLLALQNCTSYKDSPRTLRCCSKPITWFLSIRDFLRYHYITYRNRGHKLPSAEPHMSIPSYCKKQNHLEMVLGRPEPPLYIGRRKHSENILFSSLLKTRKKKNAAHAPLGEAIQRPSQIPNYFGFSVG